MIRLTVFAVVAVVVLSELLRLPQWLVGIVVVSIIAWAAGTGTLRLRCPSCRKRVKLGASACHHCGRPVARTQG